MVILACVYDPASPVVTYVREGHEGVAQTKFNRRSVVGWQFGSNFSQVHVVMHVTFRFPGRESSGSCLRPVSRIALPNRFAVEISRPAAGDFFSASAVRDPEAAQKLQKKWPLGH